MGLVIAIALLLLTTGGVEHGTVSIAQALFTTCISCALIFVHFKVK